MSVTMTRPVPSEYERRKMLAEAGVQGIAANAWYKLGYPELACVSATRAAHYAFTAEPELRRQTE